MINEFDHYQDVHSTAYFSTIGSLKFYLIKSSNFGLRIGIIPKDYVPHLSKWSK